MDEPAITAPTHDPVSPETVAWRFAQARLAPPPIPDRLAPRLRAYDEWVFSTFDPPAPPYDILHYLVELGADDAEDGLLIAHDGHGVMSWALHYYLLNGPLACFLQLPWGRAVSDDTADVERIATAFEHVNALCAAPLPDGETLCVVDAFDLQFWTRTRTGEEPVTEESFDPLGAALNYVTVGEPAGDAGPAYV